MPVCRSSSTVHDFPNASLDADCEDIVLDKIEQWSESTRRGAGYGNSELSLHKQMWDVLIRNKKGLRKENSFLDWCRRITSISAATEHANDESRFQHLAKDILAHDLTPEQEEDPKYRIREDLSITTKQRSLVNVVLRKNLGDSRVAVYILEHGIPTLLHSSTTFHAVETEHLLNILEELMKWYSNLLQWLTKHKADPKTMIAQKLAALDQKPWQTERRRRKGEAQQQLRKGARLAELRDSDRKRYHDMSATEQRAVEDFDCGKLKKLHDKHAIWHSLKPGNVPSKVLKHF